MHKPIVLDIAFMPSCCCISMAQKTLNFLLSCGSWCGGIVIVLKCWLLCMIVSAPLNDFKQVKNIAP